MKTKAFSKEGLGQAAKLDPKEKARNEMREWINDTVTKLTTEARAHAPQAALSSCDRTAINSRGKLQRGVVISPQPWKGSASATHLGLIRRPPSKASFVGAVRSAQIEGRVRSHTAAYKSMMCSYMRCAQTETFDAEMEGLVTGQKKKGKPPPRQAHLEESIGRHKAHITRLEQLLRLLDNEVRPLQRRRLLEGMLLREGSALVCDRAAVQAPGWPGHSREVRPYSRHPMQLDMSGSPLDPAGCMRMRAGAGRGGHGRHQGKISPGQRKKP
jgi:hypothetical protein